MGVTVEGSGLVDLWTEGLKVSDLHPELCFVARLNVFLFSALVWSAPFAVKDAVSGSWEGFCQKNDFENPNPVLFPSLPLFSSSPVCQLLLLPSSLYLHVDLNPCLLVLAAGQGNAGWRKRREVCPSMCAPP